MPWVENTPASDLPPRAAEGLSEQQYQEIFHRAAADKLFDQGIEVGVTIALCVLFAAAAAWLARARKRPIRR